MLANQSRKGGMMTPTKKFLWPHELGREVGISSATVRRLADSGAVEVVRDAKGRRRFKPEAIEILRRKLGLEEVTEGAEASHDHAPDAT
jgi:MerR HTH family regulatory protein